MTDGESGGPTKESTGTLSLLGQVTGLIAPTLALIAGIALTGNVGRVQRNDPGLFAVALALLIVAGALWILASIARGAAKESSQPSCWRSPRLLMVFAVIAASLGNAGAISLTVMSASKQATPRLTAALSKDANHLQVTAKSERLAIDERVVVLIDGMRKLASGRVSTQGIYQGSFGPDGEGTVDQTISTYLPPGSYLAVRVKAFSSDEANRDKCLTRPADRLRIQRRLGVTLTAIPESGQGAACLQFPVVSAKTSLIASKRREKILISPR